MKTTVRIFGMLLLLSFSTAISAQGFLERVAKKAAQKAEEKAEERVDKKIEDQIDKELDKTEEALEGDKEDAKQSDANEQQRDQKRMNALMKKMGVSTSPVPIAEKYEFSSKMKMHYENLDSDGNVEDKGDVITYISPGKRDFAYEFMSGSPEHHEGPAKGVFIMDYANEATVILSEENGEKTGVVYGLKFFGEEQQADEEDYVDDYEDNNEIDYMNKNVRKTGRTKDILGYKCEEYAYDTEEDEGSFWVAKNLDRNAKDVFSAIFKSSLYGYGVFDGVLMESRNRDKSSGEVTTMEVTEIDNDAKVEFTTNDYELTNLGSINMGEDDEMPEQ